MSFENSFTNPNQQTALVVDVDEDWRDAINRIDNMTRVDLGREYHIALTWNLQATTIAYVYIKNMFKYVKELIELTGENAANLNFMDLLEVAIDRRTNPDAEKEGNLVPYVAPGYQAKLLVKSDALTEDN